MVNWCALTKFAWLDVYLVDWLSRRGKAAAAAAAVIIKKTQKQEMTAGTGRWCWVVPHQSRDLEEETFQLVVEAASRTGRRNLFLFSFSSSCSSSYFSFFFFFIFKFYFIIIFLACPSGHGKHQRDVEGASVLIAISFFGDWRRLWKMSRKRRWRRWWKKEEEEEGKLHGSIVCGHVQVVNLFMIDDVVFECHRFSNLFVRISLINCTTSTSVSIWFFFVFFILFLFFLFCFFALVSSAFLRLLQFCFSSLFGSDYWGLWSTNKIEKRGKRGAGGSLVHQFRKCLKTFLSLADDRWPGDYHRTLTCLLS